jgi:hypothetical protein
MPYYEVTSPICGLPLGRIIKVIPKFPLEDGETIVCSINGRITVGSLHKNVAGLTWIRQRERLIPLIGKIVVCVLGVVDDEIEE